MKFMPALLFAALGFSAISCNRKAKEKPVVNIMPCKLAAEKTRLAVGEVPRLKVTITNSLKRDIYLIKVLDGSDVRWRMPHCYFTISGPVNESDADARCGNMNGLKITDFVPVKAGETFDPYQAGLDDNGFLRDYTTGSKENFGTPGRYVIQFHYSTNSPRLDDFQGDGINENDSAGIHALFDKTPKMELASNKIELTFE